MLFRNYPGGDPDRNYVWWYGAGQPGELRRLRRRRASTRSSTRAGPSPTPPSARRSTRASTRRCRQAGARPVALVQPVGHRRGEQRARHPRPAAPGRAEPRSPPPPTTPTSNRARGWPPATPSSVSGSAEAAAARRPAGGQSNAWREKVTGSRPASSHPARGGHRGQPDSSSTRLPTGTGTQSPEVGVVRRRDGDVGAARCSGPTPSSASAAAVLAVRARRVRARRRWR